MLSTKKKKYTYQMITLQNYTGAKSSGPKVVNTAQITYASLKWETF